MSLSPDLLLQVLANTAAKWSLYMTLAIGFGLLYRALRVFHVTFAVLVIAPPYIAAVALKLGAWPIAAALLAVGLTLSAALLLEASVFRPLARRDGGTEGGMIASLGVYVLLQSLIGAVFGFAQIRPALLSQGSWTLGEVVIAKSQVVTLALGLVALGALALIERSRLGIGLRALGDSPRLLALCGTRIGLLRLGAWTCAGGFAAAAGLAVANDLGVDPRSGMQLFLAAAVAVFLGGVERPAGWLAASLALAVVENLTPLFVEAKWAPTALYAVALALLIFRPRGLAGLTLRSGRVHG